MKKYRAVLFDADDTLFDYPTAEEAALRAVWNDNASALAWETFRDTYSRHNLALWRELEAGRVTAGSLNAERFRRAFSELGLDEATTLRAAALYIEVLSTQVQLLPGARELIENLAPRYPLALVTNGLAAVQKRRFARSAIGHLFSSIVISEEAGMAKPDPRIFIPVLKKLGVKEHDVLFVGDGIFSDMAAARNAAIDFCWFNPNDLPVPEDFAPKHIARTLEEIGKILT